MLRASEAGGSLLTLFLFTNSRQVPEGEGRRPALQGQAAAALNTAESS